ncbi:MAG TPA: ATP-dependent DNA helicase [Legionellales bacterium]|nr:ATP-dependent DNA helicase [Legionellales bacterium]|tara:strand:- start:2190 stop:5411 length:3222 start_codon:yes stop_codon:yes gene_type:complete
MTEDKQQRLEATNPKRSFIVQAPAGSGKTELLTQRFLRLLGLVKAPEHIYALTFTKKAAGEMRARILAALEKAANNTPPTSAHEQLTHQYAQQALEQNMRLQWQLLTQPSRLRIMTIDALCQQLVHTIFTQDKPLTHANIAEKPKPLYLKAVRACLQDALNDDQLKPLVHTLLNHLDGRQDKLIELLSELLARREQWLTAIYANKDCSKAVFEEALALIIAHELTCFTNTLPDDMQKLMHQTCQLLATIEQNPASPSHLFLNWQQFEQIDADIGQSLAHLLLTKDNKVRKQFTHHVGLTKKSGFEEEYVICKKLSQKLLYQLSSLTESLQALERLKNLPKPVYAPAQWHVLQTLLTLLPRLVAHLYVIFNEQNTVDFSALATQATYALGDELEPTDLSLYLDNTIYHLLIDEFQDTSIQQFELLTKLTFGWLPDGDKTLFIVGDPMQSIYRFRQAEVGLFLKVKQQGLGAILPDFLELTCNFRASSTLIDWVNQHFSVIFPQCEDIESGAISYHASVASFNTPDSVIKAYSCSSKEHEAWVISQKVQKLLQQNNQDTIAILVRARTHLRCIIKQLRLDKIDFQGVEIESLAHLNHVQDIWALTQALLMPANRLAWLSVLRSPLAGLDLNDLHVIANFAPQSSIYHALSHITEITELSTQGSLRAAYFFNVISSALTKRYQTNLSHWIGLVFQKLHGLDCYSDKELADIEQFFNLIDKHELDGLLMDWALFEEDLTQLYSKNLTAARLHIMTIHKAKGLEFDSVILPSLGSMAQKDNNPLLRWLKLPTASHDLHILSPIHAPYHDNCSLYNYVAQVAAEKDRFEHQRLLYVAVTRAKKNLYLFDNHQTLRANSFRQLLAAQSFETLDSTLDSSAIHLPKLKRLPCSRYEDSISNPLAAQENGEVVTALKKITINDTKILLYELLIWCTQHNPQTLDDLPWAFINNQLVMLGLKPPQIATSLAFLKQRMHHILLDPIALWIFKPHQKAHTHYKILSFVKQKAVTHCIDRMLIDNQICWLIQFNLEDEATYESASQTLRYYAYLLSSYLSLPIKGGIYYANTQTWRTQDLTGVMVI